MAEIAFIIPASMALACWWMLQRVRTQQQPRKLIARDARGRFKRVD